jgi:hypothetical protein
MMTKAEALFALYGGATIASLSAARTWRDVTCPECGQPPGKPCPSRGSWSGPHDARRALVELPD